MRRVSCPLLPLRAKVPEKWAIQTIIIWVGLPSGYAIETGEADDRGGGDPGGGARRPRRRGDRAVALQRSRAQARPRHALPQGGPLAAAGQPRRLAAKPILVSGADRLPRRRVPLPGLPLRRQRRAPGARPERPADRRATCSPSRTAPTPTRRTRLRQQRRRPRRAARQAARRRDAFRVTLNTLKDPSLVAFTIAIGGAEGEPRPFPFGANVQRAGRRCSSPCTRRRQELVADLTARDRQASPAGAAASSSTARGARSRCAFPHAAWNPRPRDRAPGRRRRPVGRRRRPLPAARRGAQRDRARRRRRPRPSPPAFFNVAFRTDEPLPGRRPTAPTSSPTRPGGATRAQGNALAAGDISPLLRQGRLRASCAAASRDDSGGPEDRADEPHPGQPLRARAGRRLQPALPRRAGDCPGQYQGRLQPYAIYVPTKPRPAERLRA